MASCKPVLLAVAVLLAPVMGGCAVREDIALSNRQGWERFKHTDWGNSMAEFTGLSKLNPGPARREAAADAELCNHPAGQTRVTRQDGIEDSVSYRRCAVSPYASGAAASGSRLSGR